MKGVWSRIAVLVILIIAISYLQSIPPTVHASLLSTYDQDDPVTAIIPSASENHEFKRYIPKDILDYHVEGSLHPIDVYFEPFIAGAKFIEIWTGDEIGFITVERTAHYKTSFGSIHWKGAIEHSAPGVEFSIYRHKGGYGLAGGFNIGRRHFGIEIEKNTNQQYIWETDPSVLKRIVDPPSDSIQRKILRRMKKHDSYKSKYQIPKSETVPPQETPIIDVLILYSKRLDDKYSDLKDIITGLISTSNQALTSSNANAELHLVDSMLAGYEDVACTRDGMHQALMDLMEHVGAFAGVPMMRDILAADLVIWLQDGIIADGQEEIALGIAMNPDTPTAHAYLPSTYDQDDPVTAIIPSVSENLEFKRYLHEFVINYHIKGSIQPINVDIVPFIAGAKFIKLWIGDDIGFIMAARCSHIKFRTGSVEWQGVIIHSTQGVLFSVSKYKGQYRLTGSLNYCKRQFHIGFEHNTSQQYIWEADLKKLPKIVY